MSLHLHLSMYWLLPVLAAGLGVRLYFVAETDHGGYLAGFDTIFELFKSLLLFLAVTVVLLLIDKFTA